MLIVEAQTEDVVADQDVNQDEDVLTVEAA